MQRAKAEFRRWHLSKLAPKQYGEKITHSGDAQNPLAVLFSQLGKSALPLSIDGAENDAA
jgi:hypothetical protein